MDPLDVTRQRVRWNVFLMEPAELIGLFRQTQRATTLAAKKVEHYVLLLRYCIYADQIFDVNEQASLFLYLAHDRLPWRLVRLDSSSWKVPHVAVRAVTKQDPSLLVKDCGERTESWHNKQRWARLLMSESATPVSAVNGCARNALAALQAGVAH
jgi:hypothetical protein